jgi:hypothetical protein
MQRQEKGGMRGPGFGTTTDLREAYTEFSTVDQQKNTYRTVHSPFQTGVDNVPVSWPRRGGDDRSRKRVLGMRVGIRVFMGRYKIREWRIHRGTSSSSGSGAWRSRG